MDNAAPTPTPVDPTPPPVQNGRAPLAPSSLATSWLRVHTRVSRLGLSGPSTMFSGPRLLALVAMGLAAASQVLALIDPIIFGKLIDGYATQKGAKPDDELVRGALMLLALAVGVGTAWVASGRWQAPPSAPAPAAAPPFPFSILRA